MSDSIKTLLAVGIVHFIFEKKDGKPREAFGTTDPKLVPKYSEGAVEKLVDNASVLAVSASKNDIPDGLLEKVNKSLEPFMPKEAGAAKQKPENIITYYDLGSKGWRSFDIERLTRVILAPSSSKE